MAKVHNIMSGRYPVHIDWLKHRKAHAGGDRRHNEFMVPDLDEDLFTSTCDRLRGFLAEEADALYADTET